MTGSSADRPIAAPRGVPNAHRRARAIAASAGGVLGVVLVFHDVAQKRRAQEALHESEARFRTLANAIPQLAWIAQPDGFINWYNQRWYEYTGTTPEQMEGWGWQSVHDPAALPSVLERWKGSIATGQPLDMVFPLKGSDGKFRPFLTRVQPLKDAEGRVVQWFGTNTDISERAETEQALRESAEKLKEADRNKNHFLAVLSHELRNPLAPISNSLYILDRASPGGEQARRAQSVIHRRVLIIEDNIDAADSLRETLEFSDHEVAVAYNGSEGIAKARELRPEIVLCDIGLPGMDGYEVARAIRADGALKGIVLVALSGYALPEDLQRAQDAGFDRHLSKPPDLEKLEGLLATLPVSKPGGNALGGEAAP